MRRSERTSPADGIDFNLMGMVRPSPWSDVVYELKPGLVGTFRGKPMRSNRFGMRGPDVEPRKPAGTRRVVGLGDSHMFGWGVGQHEVYLALLESRLQAVAPDRGAVEVLNFAVPGYNTTMEVETLEHRALAFEPDLVVIHFFGNDLQLPRFLQPDSPAAGRRSLLLDLLRRRFGSALEPAPELVRRESEALTHSVTRRYQHMVGPAAYERAMARLGALTRPRSLPVVVLMLGELPALGGLPQRTAREQGFVLLDAGPTFRRHLEALGLDADGDAARRLFQLPNEDHPSPLAHQLYADALAPVVAELLSPL